MHPNDGRVVSNFIVQALKGNDITIYGDGSQTRSFQYVDDLVEGMIRMMATREDFTGPVNIGNPREFTILQLAEKVISLTNSKSKIIRMPLPPTILDTTPARYQPGKKRTQLVARNNTRTRTCENHRLFCFHSLIPSEYL